MRPEERDAALLWDMLSYCQQAFQFIETVTFERFLDNPALMLASERALEIVGEAANHVSPSFQASHPEVAWSDIIGLRNVLIHGYSRVDHEIIWTVLTEHVPVLIRQLEALLPPEPESRL